MNMNSTRTRVAIGLTLAIVGMTGAFAVKNGLAEIQRLTPTPELAATAAAVPRQEPSPQSERAAPESGPPQSADAPLEPDPFARDPQVPRAEITTVEPATRVEEKRLEPIPETEEFHSRIFHGTEREDVRLPVNESAPNVRDPE